MVSPRPQIKTHFQTKTHTQMFVAASWMTDQKQCKCPSTGECRSKLWRTHVMECPATRRNKPLVNVRWMNLSHRSDTRNSACVWLHRHEILGRSIYSGREQIRDKLGIAWGVTGQSPEKPGVSGTFCILTAVVTTSAASAGCAGISSSSQPCEIQFHLYPTPCPMMSHR